MNNLHTAHPHSPFFSIHFVRILLLGLGVFTASAGITGAEEPATNPGPELSQRQSIAVALNYCRASFHRIKTNPSVAVLKEEEEKILNNLNLNGIADEDVIKLYSSVLDEIGQIQLADRERELFHDKYKYAIRQRMAVNAVAFGTQVATAQIGSAVRTGADSWWDYRSNEMNRDIEIWRVEKTRMNEVVSKSSRFLDTFWKLTQKNDIPDRWLVRGDDLDKLEVAIREPKPEVRLRVLQRMEPFMECYPPYWYYLGRTQQSLGQLFAAAKTYEHLAMLGTKHFRKDDMLAAALSNRAIIQEYLGQPGSATTARRALTYSTEVPQANLMCAGVLDRAGCIAEAEDAILRNIDVDLERPQSMVTLLSLYYRNDNTDKMIARLEDADTVREIPIPVLAQCAAKIGNERMPAAVSNHFAASLNLYPRFSFGKDDLVLVAAPSWQLHDAQVSLSWQGQKWDKPQHEERGQLHQARFAGILELGHPFAKNNDLSQVEVTLKYPDTPEIKIHLQQGVTIAAEPATVTTTAERPPSPGEPNVTPVASRQTTPGFRLTSLAVGEKQVTLVSTNAAVENDRLRAEDPAVPNDAFVPPAPAPPAAPKLIELKGIDAE